MSDELQVQNPTGLQVQGSPTFQQTGSGNTQIGYIGQQINYISMGGMPQLIAGIAAHEWRNKMKDVLLLFTSVISLVAFVLISVTMINTKDESMLGWMIATLVISLGSALILRWRYERGKQ